MTPEFWRNRRVLVTGHTGFKGGWLCLWLQKLGANVTGVALAPATDRSLFGAVDVARGMRSVIADIRDFPALAGVFQNVRPEVVIHMAAQSLVQYSYREPLETYSTNVMGTLHVFEAARRSGGVRAIVNVTSDKCYENNEWVWGYREIDRLGGFDPYSNSKACAELVTASYRSSYFNPSEHAAHLVALASARAGNVIGGGDWAVHRLVPDILRAAEAGRPVLIRNPESVRPWQHVLEPLSGYLVLAERLYTRGAVYADGWNFGPDPSDARPVRWIVERLTSLWGRGASWQLDKNPAPHEANYLALDCTKARSQLDWRPCWGLETALEAIVTWHQALLAGRDMRSVTLGQIESYCDARQWKLQSA